MLHPKKKPRAREEERKIRNPTTLLYLTMIICLPLTSSLRYPCWDQIAEGYSISNTEKCEGGLAKKWGAKVPTTQ
jgi:hypothetical protein